jgi:threonine/homoserine/homoserine lactone efflux protein
MTTAFATGGLILAAAITPGPNNFLVLKLAAERGLRSALTAIAGIVAGGLAMIALAQVGLGVFVVRHPWIRDGIVACGASYLAALGVLLVYRSFSMVSLPAVRERIAPNGVLALFAFQFLNPKAWVLVLTVSVAAGCVGQCDRESPTVTPLLLFATISSACLLMWATLGRLAARIMRRERVCAWFDRAMGLLLVSSAVSLVLA